MCIKFFIKHTILLWNSILAPLSWFVLFKGHSFVHKQQDPIVWFMPFMFYGIGLLGITAEKFLRAVWFSKRMQVIKQNL